MNLLVIDATKSRVAFAVFSASTRIEELLSGHVDNASSEPISLKDAGGRELVAMSMPQGLGDEAYLAWIVQWFDTRNIRLDAICHRVSSVGVEPSADYGSAVIKYMRSVHCALPQVACAVEVDGLLGVARAALHSLALPFPAAGEPGEANSHC